MLHDSWSGATISLHDAKIGRHTAYLLFETPKREHGWEPLFSQTFDQWLYQRGPTGWLENPRFESRHWYLSAIHGTKNPKAHKKNPTVAFVVIMAPRQITTCHIHIFVGKRMIVAVYSLPYQPKKSVDYVCISVANPSHTWRRGWVLATPPLAVSWPLPKKTWTMATYPMPYWGHTPKKCVNCGDVPTVVLAPYPCIPYITTP